MIAVYHSFLPIVHLLLENGADPTVRDCYGKTVLDRAKHPEIRRLLLEQLSAEKAIPLTDEREQPNFTWEDLKQEEPPKKEEVEDRPWETTTGKFINPLSPEENPRDHYEENPRDHYEETPQKPEQPTYHVEAPTMDDRSFRSGQSWRQWQSEQDRRADGFLSFGNRWEMKNQLSEQINSELRGVTDYLLTYSNERIRTFVPEESIILSKKMFNELGNTMDHLEEQIQLRFEESINKRLGDILGVLKSQPRNSSPGMKKAAGTLSPPAKEYSSILGVSSSKNKFRENVGESSSERKRSPGVRSYASRTNASWQQEELHNSRRITDTKSKIQSIKDTLNINFELSPTGKFHSDTKKRAAVA